MDTGDAARPWASALYCCQLHKWPERLVTGLRLLADIRHALGAPQRATTPLPRVAGFHGKPMWMRVQNSFSRRHLEMCFLCLKKN